MNSSSSPEIISGLELLRARRRRMWMALIYYLPVVLLVFLVFHSDTVAMIVALLWLALYTVAGIVVCLSVCPRCGDLFHFTGLFFNPWTSRCLHCGLSIK